MQRLVRTNTFILSTDASGRGIGAVLGQEDDQGVERPVAFYSRKLLPRETKYTITELECLAVVNAVKHFDVYLIGNHFKLITDHKALQHLRTMRNGGARLNCWILALQPFSFTTEYRTGRDSSNADGLSRQAWSDDPGSSLLKEGEMSGNCRPNHKVT